MKGRGAERDAAVRRHRQERRGAGTRRDAIAAGARAPAGRRRRERAAGGSEAMKKPGGGADLAAFKAVPATPSRWADLEALFGERGACGGCWCMVWRLSRKEWLAGEGAGN